MEVLGEEPYIVLNEHLQSAEASAAVPIEQILTVGGDPAAALLAEARPTDLVIMGTPSPAVRTEQRDASSDGSPAATSVPLTLRVSEEKGPPLLLLHTPEQLDIAHYRGKVRGPRTRKSWEDMPFEHWFVENTFHGDEFKDPAAFMEAKRRSGLTISVALLTSNDAEHIYSAIMGLKKVLVEMNPIADQIAVIDAGSTDGTTDIARSLGVRSIFLRGYLARKRQLARQGRKLVEKPGGPPR